MKWQLDHGADPNLLDHRGQEPAVYAAYSGNLEIVKLLMEGGTSVAETRALIGAAAAKVFNPKVAEYLINLGVDVNRLERDVDGDGFPRDTASKYCFGTALHRAIESEDPERVRFLLRHGANPMANGLKPHCKTSIEVAEFYRLPEIVKALRSHVDGP